MYFMGLGVILKVFLPLPSLPGKLMYGRRKSIVRRERYGREQNNVCMVMTQ